LIEKGANIEAVNRDKKTPLHCAAGRGHLAVVQYLVSKGASKEALDMKNRTPLQLAITEKRNDVTSFLSLQDI